MIRGFRSRALALAPIPLAFALGGFAARAWALRHPARFAVDFAQPYVIVTAWGSYGAVAFAILAASVTLAGIALVLATRGAAAVAQDGDLGPVLAIAALSLAAIALWPFGFSSDVYAYAAYGAMLGAGLDPYALVPEGAHGAFIDAARWQWSGTYPVCVYGPIFVALAWLADAASGARGGAGAALIVLRGGAMLAFLGSVVLLDGVLRERPLRERTVLIRAYALNPVVLWSAAEGHNDAWLMLALAATLRAAPRQAIFAAAGIAVSLLVKAPAALYGLARALDGRFEPRSRVAALAGVAAGLALWLPWMLPALRSLGTHGHYAPALSAQGLLGPWIASALAAAAGIHAARRLRSGSRSGYAWVGIAATLALPNPYPWYALWLVPLGVLAGPGAPTFALWGATFCSLLRYLPDASGDPGTGPARLAAALTIAPLAYALLERNPSS